MHLELLCCFLFERGLLRFELTYNTGRKREIQTAPIPYDVYDIVALLYDEIFFYHYGC